MLIVTLAASAAIAATLHVGEVGKVIQYLPNASPAATPTVNLTGLTVVMKMQRPDASATADTMAVSGDGTNATCPTVAGDFTVSGNYLFQWFASSTDSSLILKSDQTTIYVGPSF